MNAVEFEEVWLSSGALIFFKIHGVCVNLRLVRVDNLMS